MATAPRVRGAIPIFRALGIPVFLHWSWAAVAVLVVLYRADQYDSVLFPALEYLGLFGVVLLHELGHALACRSVGGTVSHILLWPLGGVAHVRPPQRPGALLWSIAAGPLVNLVLGLLGMAGLVAVGLVGSIQASDLGQVLLAFTAINVGLFVFNLVPVYPLDGGQIARALLWFAVGRTRSLTIAAGLGVVSAVIGGLVAFVFLKSWWLLLLGGYAAWRSLIALRFAKALDVVESGPRHLDARCPVCGEHPPAGPYWRCENGHAYDGIAHRGRCPECGAMAGQTSCIFCGEVRPIRDYLTPSLRPSTTTQGIDRVL